MHESSTLRSEIRCTPTLTARHRRAQAGDRGPPPQLPRRLLAARGPQAAAGDSPSRSPSKRVPISATDSPESSRGVHDWAHTTRCAAPTATDPSDTSSGVPFWCTAIEGPTASLEYTRKSSPSAMNDGQHDVREQRVDHHHVVKRPPLDASVDLTRRRLARLTDQKPLRRNQGSRQASAATGAASGSVGRGSRLAACELTSCGHQNHLPMQRRDRGRHERPHDQGVEQQAQRDRGAHLGHDLEVAERRTTPSWRRRPGRPTSPPTRCPPSRG